MELFKKVEVFVWQCEKCVKFAVLSSFGNDKEWGVSGANPLSDHACDGKLAPSITRLHGNVKAASQDEMLASPVTAPGSLHHLLPALYHCQHGGVSYSEGWCEN